MLRARRAIADGRPIDPMPGQDRDRYGRIVAICRASGDDLGAVLVREGLAWAIVRYSSDYVGQEGRAKAARAGVHARGRQPAVGYRNVDQLKAVMTEVEAAHHKLIGSITQRKATFSALAMRFDQLGRDVDARSNGWTGRIRQTLEAEMARTGYRPKI